MTEAVLIALIGAAVSTIASLIAAWVSIMNGRKVDTVAVKVNAVVEKSIPDLSVRVEEVHKATNGLTEKLKDAALAAGRAEGHAAGMQDQRTNTSVRENGRAEGVRDEKLRRAEITEEVAARPLVAGAEVPVPVKVVAAVPVPVKETPDKDKP